MTTNKNFTLIELLIVLAIIGAVATLALDQSSEVVDQTRYDLTEQNGTEIQNAIIGDIENGGRFLRDMGRLPIVISTDQGRVLEELWNADSATHWQDLTIVPSWNETVWGSLPTNIVISAGWRGPYLNMGARTELYDGWGNPWAVDLADSSSENWKDNDGDNSTYSAPTIGGSIYGIKSLGRNQEEDGDGWQNKDKLFKLPENRVFCSAAFSIKVRDNSGRAVTPKAISSYVASTAYTVGQSVVVGTDIFTVQTAGTSHASAPSWDTATAGTSTTIELSSTLVWLYVGKISDNPEYLQSVRVVLFVPDVRDDEMGIVELFSEWDGDDAINDDFEVLTTRESNDSFGDLFIASTIGDLDGVADDSVNSRLVNGFGTIRISGLTPGIRKFYIYGFNGNYRRGSFVQTTSLKPGSNFREVILTEPLD